MLYTNGLAVIPTSLIGWSSGEMGRLKTVEWTTMAVFWLLPSCVVGTGISWAGFKCQSCITATAYTVVGVVNKMITVLCNVLIWDQHASGAGIASLLICLVGGALYQQAPLRPASVDGPCDSPRHSKSAGSEDDEVEVSEAVPLTGGGGGPNSVVVRA